MVATPLEARLAAPHGSDERRVYRNPPVVEALVDFKVERTSPLELAALAALHKGEEEQYPERQALMSGSVTFDAGAGSVVESSQSMTGYRISDAKGSRIAQFRIDGYTFSRLQPYDQWESWRDEAKRLWERYVAETEPAKVIRIAVRYTNRLDLKPGGGERLRDFLNVYPEVPESIPNRMAGFIMRLELIQPDLKNGMLILSVGRTQPPSEGIVSVLLDLDLFQQRLDEDPRSRDLWNVVEELHARENHFFESCISDRTREFFT